MTTITRERIEQALDNPAKIILNYGETLELARIALAALKVECVGEVSEQRDGLVLDGTVDLGGTSTHRIIKGASRMKRLPLGTKFYTAPVVPVVPDDLAKAFISAIEKEQDRLFGEDYLMDSKDCIDVIREEAYCLNACRAAMLEGDKK